MRIGNRMVRKEKYSRAHREEINEYSRAYCAAHPEQKREEDQIMNQISHRGGNNERQKERSTATSEA